MRRMKKYTPTKFKAKDSVYDKAKADYPKGNDRHSRQYIAAFGKRACDKQVEGLISDHNRKPEAKK